MVGFPEATVEDDLSEAFYDFAHPAVLHHFGGEWDRKSLERLVKDKACEFIESRAQLGGASQLAADFLHRL